MGRGGGGGREDKGGSLSREYRKVTDGVRKGGSNEGIGEMGAHGPVTAKKPHWYSSIVGVGGRKARAGNTTGDCTAVLKGHPYKTKTNQKVCAPKKSDHCAVVSRGKKGEEDCWGKELSLVKSSFAKMKCRTSPPWWGKEVCATTNGRKVNGRARLAVGELITLPLWGGGGGEGMGGGFVKFMKEGPRGKIGLGSRPRSVRGV